MFSVLQMGDNEDCGYTEAGHLETAQPSGGRVQGGS